MNFKLNARIYFLSKILIWFAFIVFSLYYIDKIKTRETVLYELIISGFIIQLSLMSFLENWYKDGRPTLLDWFRFTTFYAILINYFSLIDKLDESIEWVYGKIYLKQELILPALLTILIGLLALKISEWVVYFLTIRKRNKHQLLQKKFFVKYIIKNEIAFYSLGCFVFSIQIYLLLTGAIGYGTFGETAVSSFGFLLQILNSLNVLFILSLGYLRYYFQLNNLKINFFHLFFFILSLLFGLLSGMKEFTIIPLVSYAIPYVMGGKKLPKKLIVFGAIILALLYPINDNYRSALNNFQGISKTDAFGIALTKTFSSDFGEVFSSSSDKFSNRLAMYPILQYSMELEPNWRYFKHMDRFVYLPVSYLPRFLVPSKPIADTGAVLNKAITGFDNNSQTPTTFGWSYLEGGEVYVFITFLLLGLVVSGINFSVNKLNLFSLLLFGDILITMLKVETDIYFLLAKILQDIIILFFFTKFLFKKKTYEVI